MDSSITLEGKKYISVSRVSKKCGYNSDYLGQLCRGGKLDCKLISRAWFVTEESLLEYNKNNGRKKVVTEKLSYLFNESTPQSFYTHNEKMLSEELKKQHVISSLNQQKNLFSKNLFVKSAVGVIACLLIVVVLAKARNRDNFSNEIFKQPADLSELKNKFNTALLNVQNKIKIAFEILFHTDERLARNSQDNENQNYRFIFGDQQAKNAGAVMIPMPQNSQDLSEVKNYLQNSFSDTIEVVPDESGVSGVIKPVFADPTTEEYFYVMVPVDK